MKKILLLFIVLLLAFSMIACGEQTVPPDPDDENVTPDDPPSQDTENDAPVDPEEPEDKENTEIELPRVDY